MKSRLLFMSALALGTLVSSCNKDKRYDANNGQTRLAYQINVENLSSGTQRSTAGNIVWTSGFANPSKVKFEAKQENSKLEYEAKHVGQIDLFAIDPVTFGNFTLGAGTYKEIELKLLFQKNGSSPAIQLGGQYTNNLMSAPILLIIDGPLEIKTEQKDVVITENTSFLAITTLDLAAYTNGITENMWMNADMTNGVIVISENSNENMYDRIIDNIRGKKHKCKFDHD